MTMSDHVTSDMCPSRWQSQVLAGFTQLWEHFGVGIKIPPQMTILGIGMYLK